MNTTPVIKVSNLVKKYDKLIAVNNVSFEVYKNECFGILGPNGAGKTTMIKIIQGFYPKNRGSLKIMNMDIETDYRKIKSIMGIVPQENNLDPDFTVLENLVIYANYFDIPKKAAKQRAEELLEFFELTEKKDVIVEELSGGMKRRLILARALINNPRILILDEPTTGLDPQARHLIWDRLKKLKQNSVTILLTTHYMEEAYALCDRLIIMDNGKIILEGIPKELVEKYIGKYVIEIAALKNEIEKIANYLQQRNIKFEKYSEEIYIPIDTPDRLFTDIKTSFQPEKIEIRRATLEDVFLKFTGRKLRE